MATQRKELVSQNQFSFTPHSLEEAKEYASIIANSGICPQSLKGRPNDVLVILQMGNELKLKPMQALRTLGCINGMPFAYGDGLLALVKCHPDFENIKEWIEGDIKSGAAIAYCTVTRKNQEPQTRSFSIEDAKRAGLWSKGVWGQYPQRMLQHRARGYACRDVFPDALYGLLSDEEAYNIPANQPIKIKSKGMDGLRETLGVQPKEEDIVDAEIVVQSSEIKEDETKDKKHPALTIKEAFFLFIAEKEIPEESQQKWCKKAKVESIDDLSEEAMLKILNHYKGKEKTNGV